MSHLSARRTSYQQLRRNQRQQSSERRRESHYGVLDRHGQVLFKNIQQRGTPAAKLYRLGIAIAGAIIAVGLAFVGTAMVRLDLLENLDANAFAMVAGFTLVLLGAVAIASYGVVRAIEWASRNR